MRRMLEESTTVIIMGSPSGTATTITVMARVRACRMQPIIWAGLPSVCRMRAGCMALSSTMALKRSAAATAAAATKPKRLRVLARRLRRSFSGLSRVSSCISWAIPP